MKKIRGGAYEEEQQNSQEMYLQVKITYLTDFGNNHIVLQHFKPTRTNGSGCSQT